jgi:hypothetical protein
MPFGPSSTIEMQCNKIKTALPACFDKILVTHHRNTTKKVTFTSDLPWIPLYLTYGKLKFMSFNFTVCGLHFTGIYHCAVVMCKEFWVAVSWFPRSKSEGHGNQARHRGKWNIAKHLVYIDILSHFIVLRI